MDHWSSPNGCHPDCPACQRDREDSLILAYAAKKYGTGSLFVDHEGAVDRVEDGRVWVQAFVCLVSHEVKEALSAKD